MSVVLVTGAGGFVGSAIVRALSKSAHFADGTRVEQVVALLRPGGSGHRLAELPEDGSSSIVHADVSDQDALQDCLSRVRPRAIVHAALDADAHVCEDDARFVGSPLAILFGALAGVHGARFLHVGSAWVLPAGDRLDESTPLRPVTVYGRTKARADALLPDLAARAGVPWINLRLFNMFGRWEKPTRLLPTLVASLKRGEVAELTHGNQVRDFNDVDVVARSFVAALAAPEAACGAVYHVGSGQGTTVRDFALTVASVIGEPGLIRFGAAGAQDEDLPCLVADPTRAERILGWQPDRELPRSIRRAAEWWLERLPGPIEQEVTA